MYNEKINKNVIISISTPKQKEYVKNAKEGNIVAFKTTNGKVKSAAVEMNDSENGTLHLVTKYGAKYIVEYDNVLWVKTGNRWPKYIYVLLKGVNSRNENESRDGEQKQ